MLGRIKLWLHHPMVNLLVGVVMIGAGAEEVLESLYDLGSFTLQAEHGVVLMGLVTFAKGIVEGIEGLERMDGD